MVSPAIITYPYLFSKLIKIQFCSLVVDGGYAACEWRASGRSHRLLAGQPPAGDGARALGLGHRRPQLLAPLHGLCNPRRPATQPLLTQTSKVSLYQL